MAYFILGVALLALTILAARWFVRAEPGDIRVALMWIVGLFAVMAAALMVATGRVGGAVLPILLGATIILRMRRSAAERYRRLSDAGSRGDEQLEMTVEEASEILGVGADADGGEIEAAFARLMQGEDPDKGGRTFVAARATRAREVLLAAAAARTRENG